MILYDNGLAMKKPKRTAREEAHRSGNRQSSAGVPILRGQTEELAAAMTWFGSIDWTDGFMIFDAWRHRQQRRKTYDQLFAKITSMSKKDSFDSRQLLRAKVLIRSATRKIQAATEPAASVDLHSAYLAWPHPWTLVDAARLLSDAPLKALLRRCGLTPHRALANVSDILRSLIKVTALGHLGCSGVTLNDATRATRRWGLHLVQARRMFDLLSESDIVEPRESDGTFFQELRSRLLEAQKELHAHRRLDLDLDLLDEWIPHEELSEFPFLTSCADLLDSQDARNVVFGPSRANSLNADDIHSRLLSTVVTVISLRDIDMMDQSELFSRIRRGFDSASKLAKFWAPSTLAFPHNRKQIARQLGRALLAQFGGVCAPSQLARLTKDILTPILSSPGRWFGDSGQRNVAEPNVAIARIRLAILDNLVSSGETKFTLAGSPAYQALPLITRSRAREDGGRPDCVGLTLEQIVRSKKSFVLTGTSGGGKTCFLRALQAQLLRDNDTIAVYVEARQLVNASGSMDALSLIERGLRGVSKTPNVREVLEDARSSETLCLLVDELDSGRLSRTSITDLRIMLADAGIRLILAAQPAFAKAVADEFKLDIVTLGPLDGARFFGDAFSRLASRFGPMHPFLTIPMYAQLLRELVRESPQSIPSNLWGLYERAVKKRLQRSRRRFPLSKTLSGPFHAELELQKLALWAYNQSPPRVGSFNISDFPPLRDEQTWPLEHVVATRLLDIVHDDDSGTGFHARFVHESFQAYFAASAIRHDPNLIERVINEYWCPKWRDVLVFLAGALGSPLVELLHSPSKPVDDVLHHRLFLAAECAGQARITAPLRDYLIEQCAGLTDNNIFKIQSFTALSRMNCAPASARAWELLREEPELSDEMCLPAWISANESPLPTLYSDNRHAWALTEVEQGNLLPGLHFLAAWPWAVPEKMLPQLLTVVKDEGSVGDMALRLLCALAQRTPISVKRAALALLANQDRHVRIAGLHILISIAPKLRTAERKRLCECLDDEDIFVRRAAELGLASWDDSMDAHEARYFLQRFWRADGKTLSQCSSIPNRVKRLISDREIEGLVGAVAKVSRQMNDRSEQPSGESSSAETPTRTAYLLERALVALDMLRGCCHRLPERSHEIVCKCLNIPSLTAAAIRAITAPPADVSDLTARQILDCIRHQDYATRTCAIVAAPTLSQYITDSDLRTMIDVVRSNPEDNACGIPVLLQFADRLSRKSLDLILRAAWTIKSEQSSDWRREVFGTLAELRLQSDGTELLQSFMDEMEDGTEDTISVIGDVEYAESAIWLIHAPTATPREIVALNQLLEYPVFEVRELAFEKLNEIRIAGRLPAN